MADPFVRSSVFRVWDGRAWAAATWMRHASGCTSTWWNTWKTWEAAMDAAEQHREFLIRSERKTIALAEFARTYQEGE